MCRTGCRTPSIVLRGISSACPTRVCRPGCGMWKAAICDRASPMSCHVTQRTQQAGLGSSRRLVGRWIVRPAERPAAQRGHAEPAAAARSAALIDSEADSASERCPPCPSALMCATPGRVRPTCSERPPCRRLAADRRDADRT